MTLTKQDLVPFCSTDPERGILRTPWSKGRFTYATNGHVLVRTARLSDVPEQDDAPDPARIFKATADQAVTPLPAIDFSKSGLKICPDCGGGGQEDCVSCEGTGAVRPLLSVALRGALFAAHYLELIMQLPAAAFSTTPPLAAPARFVFTGGEGALMPMCEKYEHHLEVAEGQ